MVALEARDLQQHFADTSHREPPPLHAALPDGWHVEQPGVRAGDRFIELDEARLPRLTGIMGTVDLIRKGKAEFLRQTPASPQGQQEQAGALVVKTLVELAMLGVGGLAAKKGKGKNTVLFLGGLGLLGTGGVGLAMDLSGCTPAESTPPAIVTEVPATAKPIETSTPSLGNEVIPGTPSLVPETPVPVGSMYPTEVSAMTDPKVYSYGGADGRANLNEYARAMFDRYIAEMARTGLLSGASVEELYRSFDGTYDMKLFTTDAGQVYLVQSKSDGSFLVPKTQDGQLFRDLQLSYDYLFQNGVAIPVGNDNFDLQKFQANRIGFVGAWPVLVNVDGQSVPVSWVNMEKGGVATPIQLASASVTPEVAGVTATSEGQVQLSVGGETFTVTRDVKYRDGQATVDIDPSRAQKIGDLLVYSDASGRLIWNEHLASWTPEFGTNMDYSRPELSPFVPGEAYADGSAALSARLYLAEHPDFIKADAPDPHYMVNGVNGQGYYISVLPTNANAFSANEVTQIRGDTNKPFGYLGLQQTEDRFGNIIYVVGKGSLVRIPGSSDEVYPTFFGFDKSRYEKLISYPLIFKFLANDKSMVGEIVPVLPAPPGSYVAPAETFQFYDQKGFPHVRALVQQNVISLFPAEIQDAIVNMYLNVDKDYNPTTNPKSVPLSELPEGLDRLILYPGLKSW